MVTQATNCSPSVASIANLAGPDLLVIFAGGFFIWMLLDCALAENDAGNSRLIWVLIILFVPFLGSLLYYIFRKLPRNRRLS